MNIVSGGSGDLLLTGNPTKSFFKTTYSKYTPFGVQMFRIDYEGRRTLTDTHPTTFTYKVPRYGDLLYDSYFCINIPDIFSDYRCNRCYADNEDGTTPGCCSKTEAAAWAQRQDYQFAWVSDLGYTMIEEIVVSIGGSQIMRVTGEWLSILKVLGRTGGDETLIEQMIGDIPACLAPSVSNGGTYPTVPQPGSRPDGHYPSIKGRTLYVPLGTWFTDSPAQALPLVALQYQEVEVKIRLRPLSEWYTIASWPGFDANGPPVDTCGTPSPDPCPDGATPHVVIPTSPCSSTTSPLLGAPPCECKVPFIPRSMAGDPCNGNPEINRSAFPEARIQEWLAPTETGDNIRLSHFLDAQSYGTWCPDVHILARYVFLGDDERRIFAKIEQKYLIQTPIYLDFPSVDPVGGVDLDISGIIVNYVWRFQRSDAHRRNEWTNFTNYEYSGIPNVPYQAPYMRCGGGGGAPSTRPPATPSPCNRFPASQPTSGRDWNYYGVPRDQQQYYPSNSQDIMMSASLLLDGEVRENEFPTQVWNYITKYAGTDSGDLQLGVYFYSYALSDEVGELQPSGALAMGKYTSATLKFTTLTPPLKTPEEIDTLLLPADVPVPYTQECSFVRHPAEQLAADNANAAEACESWNRASGAALGKSVLARRSKYTYNLRVYIERYNVLTIVGGMAGLMYAE